MRQLVGSLMFFLGMLLLVAAGCAFLPQDTKRQVASAVEHYCVEPIETRHTLRAEVNSMLKPGTTIKVTCPGDPE